MKRNIEKLLSEYRKMDRKPKIYQDDMDQVLSQHEGKPFDLYRIVGDAMAAGIMIGRLDGIRAGRKE